MLNKAAGNAILLSYRQIDELLTRIHNLEKDEALQDKCRIPSSVYFLDDKNILCYENRDGNSRYLYANDGRVLTTYVTGGICLQEGVFNIILPSCEGKESNLAFFVGKKQGDHYFPISIFNNSKQLFEDGVKRCTVFTPTSTYYFVEEKDLVSTVRIFLDSDKNVRCSFFIKNLTNKKLSLYASTYVNCFLWARECDNQWTKAYAASKTEKDGYLISVYENVVGGKVMHYAKILRSYYMGTLQTTTSQICFKGGKNNPLTAAVSLKNGKFDSVEDFTCYKENPIASDIITFELKGGEVFNANYTIACGDGDEFLKKALELKGQLTDVEKALNYNDNVIGKNIPNIIFNGAHGKIKDYTFNCFIANVLRQVETCAKSKNFAGQYLGTRDVFQQLEAALMWCPEYSRKKIIESISFIFDNGRPPRQFSYPQYKNALPSMIASHFIDQGVWIINTVYKYLAFTGDYSILEEKCGYYKFTDKVEFSDRFDSVLDHVVSICNYLLSNIDSKTGCLKILAGDWNDSLNGLGATTESDKIFGTGVSGMATLQLYQALLEVSQILSSVGRCDESKKYLCERKILGENILKYTIVTNGSDRKVLHGWGDKRSYLVGSFNDNDQVSRYSLTSAAFFVLSGALNLDETLKKDILIMFSKLQAKYGLNTFTPAFTSKSKGVGRIANMIEGTAENGATYNHSTLFGILALLSLGEYKLAWENIEKVIPITHEKITTSPFIMSNSYIYNSSLGLDGESGGDWYTGSACVLIKVLIYKVFGVECNLKELVFKPSEYLPFSNAELEMKLHGKTIRIKYVTNNDLPQGIFVVSNGKKEKVNLNAEKRYILSFNNLFDGVEILMVNYHQFQ